MRKDNDHIPQISKTQIDLMVNAFNIQPDIDRDGDGLEKINGDGNTIARSFPRRMASITWVDT